MYGIWNVLTLRFFSPAEYINSLNLRPQETIVDGLVLCRVPPVLRWGSVMLILVKRQTNKNSASTNVNLPAHGGVPFPFLTEDQISPDQLKRAKTPWGHYRKAHKQVLTLDNNSQLISDSVFPSLVLLLVERIRWGTDTGDCEETKRHAHLQNAVLRVYIHNVVVHLKRLQ